MASAHNLPLALARAQQAQFFRVRDPGASGTISIHSNGDAYCEVTTAAAESRVLPSASGFGSGQRLAVVLFSDGGDLTITGATATAILRDAGDVVIFQVTRTLVGTTQTKVWRRVSDSSVSLALLVDSDAAPSASGLLIGGGTSAAPNTTSVAGAKFIDLYCESTAASGANRLAYFAYLVNGGGNFEAVRGRAVAQGECANVTGGGFGAEVSDTGYVTGSCASLAGTLVLANAAVPANGTYYGAQVSIYSGGTSSSLAAATKHAILGVAATGNATGQKAVLNAIAFDGAADSGGGEMISPGTSEGSAEGTIRILVNGVVKYLAYYGHEGHA